MRPGRRRDLYACTGPPGGVVHTPRAQVLRDFVFDRQGEAKTWTQPKFIEWTVAQIRDRVAKHARATGSDGRVICALSGGVDSAVAAALIHQAIGDQLTCIFVNHGLMRKKEPELLHGHLRGDLGMHLSWSMP